jgi:phosphoglycolate phosphatase
MGSIRNAIFDLDGTLIDSLPGIAWSVEAALSSCSLPLPSYDLKHFIGPPVRSILSAVAGVSHERMLDQLERSFRLSYDSSGWRKTLSKEGALDLLSQLRASGANLWIVTNKPAAVTNKILRELKIDHFFREVACRDSRNPVLSSKREVLVGLMERHALPSSECLMIGDTLEDFHAAKSAGIPCAIVRHGYGGAECEPYIPASGWDDIARLCRPQRN